MRLLVVVFTLSLAGWSQYVVDSQRVPAEFRSFEPVKGEQPLRCEVNAMKPRLDYGFRFQAGYFIQVPLKQYSGPGHSWVILTRVTPEGGGKAVYLLSAMRLPNIPKTNQIAEIGGSYLLGEGNYKVDLLLYDDSSRACRKTFRLEAKRSRSEREMTLRIEPGTVRSLASRHVPTPAGPDERPYRISVLVDAAPFFPRATRLRAWDREMLLGTLGPLLELLPAQSVRLVVFNLDQQKTLFTRDGFRLEDLTQVAQALNTLQLGTVNYSVLKNKAGHIDLLADLINQEIHGTQPPDAVVFLGPIARSIDHFPKTVLAGRGGGDDPSFFYVQYRPLFDRSAFADVIENAVRAMKGKVFHIHTPSEFAAAIRQISKF